MSLVILLRTRHGSRKFDIDEAAGLLVRSPTQLKTALGRAPVMSYAKRPRDDEVPAEQMGIKELKAALRVAGVDTSKMLDKAELVSALNNYRSEQRPTKQQGVETHNERVGRNSASALSHDFLLLPAEHHGQISHACVVGRPLHGWRWRPRPPGASRCSSSSRSRGRPR